MKEDRGTQGTLTDPANDPPHSKIAFSSRYGNTVRSFGRTILKCEGHQSASRSRAFTLANRDIEAMIGRKLD